LGIFADRDEDLANGALDAFLVDGPVVGAVATVGARRARRPDQLGFIEGRQDRVLAHGSRNRGGPMSGPSAPGSGSAAVTLSDRSPIPVPPFVRSGGVVRGLSAPFGVRSFPGRSSSAQIGARS